MRERVLRSASDRQVDRVAGCHAGPGGYVDSWMREQAGMLLKSLQPNAVDLWKAPIAKGNALMTALQ